jgi:hypothetical protein
LPHLNLVYKHNLWLGAHVYNLSRSKINANENVPVIVRFGLNYTFNKNVNASLEYEKNWIAKPLFKAGLSYKIIKDFELRTGINAGANVSTFFGAGYTMKQLSIDAAAAIDSKLGTSPSISMNYKF